MQTRTKLIALAGIVIALLLLRNGSTADGPGETTETGHAEAADA